MENGALAARNDLSIFTQIHVLSSVLPCSELYYQARKQAAELAELLKSEIYHSHHFENCRKKTGAVLQ